MSSGLDEPVPWTYTDAPGILQWTWMTDHFVARISGSEVDDEPTSELGGRRMIRAYSWDVSDLVRLQQGVPRLLIEGTSDSFEDAESHIREHVGKSFDSRLGYMRFAGSLAFTFTLSTGEVVDVSDLVGTTCAVSVLQPDGSERTVFGDLSVHHYKWIIQAPGQTLEIIPEHVVRLTNRTAVAERASAIARPNNYSGIGRIYNEDPRRGCTGRPGFHVKTVDHAGASRCPIHEVGLPESLLR